MSDGSKSGDKQRLGPAIADLDGGVAHEVVRLRAAAAGLSCKVRSVRSRERCSLLLVSVGLASSWGVHQRYSRRKNDNNNDI